MCESPTQFQQQNPSAVANRASAQPRGEVFVDNDGELRYREQGFSWSAALRPEVRDSGMQIGCTFVRGEAMDELVRVWRDLRSMQQSG